jgi:dihydrofolate synthase/folylpolyglutamate synthase
MHVAKKHPIIILDGAHNPDKIWTTVETLQQLVRQKKTKAIRLIVGYSQNKDTNTMNRLLATLRPASVACTRNTTNYFRTVADPTILKKEFQKALPKATVELFLDPKDALLWTKKHAGPNDIILITGSIFLAGEYTRLLS